MENRFTRRALRHPLVVDVEVTDLQSGIQIEERTKDLSLYGCGVSTVTPFPAGIKVMLKVSYPGKEIVAFGKVIYWRQDIGMGIAFTSMGPEDQKLLENWFAEQPRGTYGKRIILDNTKASNKKVRERATGKKPYEALSFGVQRVFEAAPWEKLLTPEPTATRTE